MKIIIIFTQKGTELAHYTKNFKIPSIPYRIRLYIIIRYNTYYVVTTYHEHLPDYEMWASLSWSHIPNSVLICFSVIHSSASLVHLSISNLTTSCIFLQSPSARLLLMPLAHQYHMLHSLILTTVMHCTQLASQFWPSICSFIDVYQCTHCTVYSMNVL